jgi:acyl CoA:acetate/3-ketoacid CoA transferase alpha subunit
MTSFLSLHDAVAEYVQYGAPIAMEGVTNLILFAAGHEIIRQQKRDLHACTERAHTGKAAPHAGAD